MADERILQMVVVEFYSLPNSCKKGKYYYKNEGVISVSWFQISDYPLLLVFFRDNLQNCLGGFTRLLLGAVYN